MPLTVVKPLEKLLMLFSSYTILKIPHKNKCSARFDQVIFQNCDFRKISDSTWFFEKYIYFSVAFFPLQIGDHVFIGEGSIVNAAVVSSYVYIGKNVIIGRRCVLKDCCYIEDNSVVPPETVVPTFTRFSGSPAKRIGELPENAQASDLCPVNESSLNVTYI